MADRDVGMGSASSNRVGYNVFHIAAYMECKPSPAGAGIF